MTRKIVYSAIYCALIMAFTFIPYTGYIFIGPVSITTIPAFIAIATWHIGGYGGFVTALTFGLGSYFKSLYEPAFALFALAPEISIIPRVMLGFLIWIIVKSFQKIKYWKVIITCLLSVILNTFLVTIGVFTIQLYRDFPLSFQAWIILIWVNFLVEISVAGFIGILLFNPLKELKKSYEGELKNEW